MKAYAGIGSRETPLFVCSQMISVAEVLAQKGYTLRSGGANGADIAFEVGCDKAKGIKEIYLPWKKFNGNQSPLHFDTNPMTDLKKKAYEIGYRYHPAWAELKDPVRRLIARNGFQVLGVDLNSPVDFILCWTPIPFEAGRSGGTFQAHLDKNGAWCHWSDVAPYIMEATAKGSPRRKAAAASV